VNIKILSRSEFSDYFNSLKPGLGDPDSPLWEAEYHFPNQFQYFIKIEPISFSKSNFWRWCYQNLKGQVRCFSSSIDSREEWWGFTDQSDIVWFSLKWN
jgi:hypothetical protein